MGRDRRERGGKRERRKGRKGKRSEVSSCLGINSPIGVVIMEQMEQLFAKLSVMGPLFF